MKKFIKALEDRGVIKNLVDTAFTSERVLGCPIRKEAVEVILEFEMMQNENLEDIFLQEAHELAMNLVFEHVQKQVAETKGKKSAQDDELLEDTITRLAKIKKTLDDIVNYIMDDGK